MKKTLFAVALAVVSFLYAGCNIIDILPYGDLDEKLMGRWVLASTDNEPALTNAKMVYNYTSPTRAYLSASFNANPERGTLWGGEMKADVKICGNRVTVTYHPGENPNSTAVHEFSVKAINDSEFSAYAKITMTINGVVVLSEQGPVRFEKVNTDYSTAILGLWEGSMVSQESEFDDGQEHRWLFKEDGTFAFYLKNDKGIWEVLDDELDEYFVAGNLLCTRWKNAGEGTRENREWWEITAAGESGMIWTALREKSDGTQYTAAFSMKKISVPTQAEIEKAIIGKWMSAEKNGEPFLTDDKGVYTFLSTTSAYMSASVKGKPGLGDLWHDFTELDVNIKDNVIMLTHKLDEHKTMAIKMTVTSIDDEKMHADVYAALTVDGTVVGTVKDHILYEKVKVNYRTPILGLWEGRRITGGTTEYHRWEYLEDGNYYFYLKKGEGQWVRMEDEISEYFVDGRLLCTRWKNAGEGTQENREWWEIRSIENDAMIWTALRQNELGEQYVESFTMNKVKVPTEDEIKEKIKSSKWMTEKINGEAALTNEKAVFTFFSRTQATISAAIDDRYTVETDWISQREFDYVVEGNTITLTHKADEHTTILDEMIIGAIDEESIHCIFYRTIFVDGEGLPYPEATLVLRKVEKTPVNYPTYIQGTWEGRAITDYSQYDDGQVHRWQYTGVKYAYYKKEGENWVLSSDDSNEYLVDGRLLLTRWVIDGVEYREWWEIVSLDDQTMIWDAVRADEHGQRYHASFVMTRVE